MGRGDNNELATDAPFLQKRQELEKQVSIAAQRILLGRPSRSFIITGGTEIEREVTLIKMIQTAENEGWHSGNIGIRADQSEPQSVRSIFATMAADAVQDWSFANAKVSEDADYLLEVIQAYNDAADDGNPTLEVAEPHRGVADSGMSGTDLMELVDEMSRVGREHKTGFLFAISEMDNLPAEDLTTITMVYHRLAQTSGPVMLLGSGSEKLPTDLFEARGYAPRLFEYHRLP